MNGTNIQDIEVDLYYEKFGVVNSESLFYGRTIAENIAYGSLSHFSTMDEIISAAKEANLHNWVTTLLDVIIYLSIHLF